MASDRITDTLRCWERDGTPWSTVEKLRRLQMIIEGKRAELALAQQAALEFIDSVEEE